ncbi:replicative DNA helicase [Planctomycetota bacterium]
MVVASASRVDPSQDYQQPYDLEAEMSLLGSILLDNSILGEILQTVNKESFYQTSHKFIFVTMVRLYDKRNPIDLVTVKDDLIRQGLLEGMGGIDYLTTLINTVPSATNALHYAKIIREKYLLRHIMLLSHQLLREASQSAVDSEMLLDRAQREIFDLVRKSGLGKEIKISEILKETFDKIIEYRDRKNRLSGLPTGLNDLDDEIGGLHPGQFVVVAGRPSMGKSSFALRLLEQVGLVENKPVCLYTLEVTKEQVVQNLLCSTARVNAQKLRSGFVSDEEIQRLMLTAAKYDPTNIFIDDTVDVSVLELKARTRRLKLDHDIQLLIVDYLQLMRIKERQSESRQVEVAFISQSLKNLAKELNISVVAISQLSRETERREPKNPRPRMSDLRESGAIEQDADVVLLLYREALYRSTPENDNLCEINIAKQRNGPAGKNIEVTFLKEYTRFDNLFRE